MMDTPAVDLPEALRGIQQKWLQAKREEQDLIYAREFGPAFVSLFSKLPLSRFTGRADARRNRGASIPGKRFSMSRS
jgi:hypothetical protein